MSAGTSFIGFTGKCYPDLYRKPPPVTTEHKPGQLSAELIKQYFEKGYLVIEDFFKKEELDDCRNAIADLVEDLAQRLFKAGKIKNLYTDYGLFQRLTKIEADFPGASIILHKQGVLPKAFQDMLTNERLLNLLEQIIGPDIMVHPVWNLRPKTPRNDATIVPWHQDSSYFDADSYNLLIPSAWIPLLDANESNGCMQVVEKGHKKGLIATHQCCHGGTWYTMVDEAEMKKTLDVDIKRDVKTCQVPYGGMLLFNNHIPHQSLPNQSNDIRWSMDLRWQKAGEPTGFWNLKDALLVRSSKDPNLKADWEAFNKVDRTKLQRKTVEDMVGDTEDEFDTVITGPWMKKWEITHVNRHTEEMDNREMRDKA